MYFYVLSINIWKYILNETFQSNSGITMGKYFQLMHMVYLIFYIVEEIEEDLNKI